MSHRDACRSETVCRARGRGAWLDEGEQARWRRYRHDGPRRRFALCRAALRAILRVRLGCRNEELAFSPASHGKPFAAVRGKPANINFNVSHSGEHGLIAVAAEGRLGVDVEERTDRRDLDGLIATVLGPHEQAMLRSASGSRKRHLFFEFWAVKEALIKAVGLGLSLDMSRFGLPPAARHADCRVSVSPDARDPVAVGKSRQPELRGCRRA